MLRIVESWELGWWLATVWEGRGGMGKKKKEKQRRRVSAEEVSIVATQFLTHVLIKKILNKKNKDLHVAIT